MSCLSSPSGPPVERRAGRESPAAIPYGSEVGDTGNEMFDPLGPEGLWEWDGTHATSPRGKKGLDWNGPCVQSGQGKAWGGLCVPDGDVLRGQ